MSRLSRANALRIAALISFVLGLYSFIASIPFLMRGATEVNLGMDSPPYFIVIAGFVLAIVRTVGAYGTWNYQRWGIVVVVIASAVDAVFAVPGILFAPTARLHIEATVGVITSVLVIILCLWRDPRPA